MVARLTVIVGALLLSFCAAPSAPAAERPTVLPYLVGLCLAEIEAAAGVPAWQLEIMRPGVMARCQGAPYDALVQLKGGGNLFVPLQELRARPIVKGAPSPPR